MTIFEIIPPNIVELARTIVLLGGIAGAVLYLIAPQYIRATLLCLFVAYVSVSIFSSYVLNAHGLKFAGVEGSPTVIAILVYLLRYGGLPFLTFVAVIWGAAKLSGETRIEDSSENEKR